MENLPNFGQKYAINRYHIEETREFDLPMEGKSHMMTGHNTIYVLERIMFVHQGSYLTILKIVKKP